MLFDCPGPTPRRAIFHMQGTCMSITIYCVVLWDQCQLNSVVTSSKARVRGDKIYKRHLLHHACLILKKHTTCISKTRKGWKWTTLCLILTASLLWKIQQIPWRCAEKPGCTSLLQLSLCAVEKEKTIWSEKYRRNSKLKDISKTFFLVFCPF